MRPVRGFADQRHLSSILTSGRPMQRPVELHIMCVLITFVYYLVDKLIWTGDVVRDVQTSKDA
jgi:hypothetical protein